jgi:hypothetical protein
MALPCIYQHQLGKEQVGDYTITMSKFRKLILACLVGALALVAHRAFACELVNPSTASEIFKQAEEARRRAFLSQLAMYFALSAPLFLVGGIVIKNKLLSRGFFILTALAPVLILIVRQWNMDCGSGAF